MKISSVVLSDKRIKNSLIDNKLTLIICSIFIAAILSSVVLYLCCSQTIDIQLKEIFLTHIESYKTKSKPEIFSDLLLAPFIFNVIVILFSTSVFGDKIVSVLLYIRILGLGLLLCFIYSGYGLIGIEYVFLVILPGKLIYILSLVLVMKNCYFTVKTIKGTGENNKKQINLIIIRLIISFLLVLISVVLDMLNRAIFSDLFTF